MTAQAASTDPRATEKRVQEVPVKRERWVSYGVVGGFLLHGGCAIINVIASFWLVKYLWAWKMFSFMPTLGAGPTASGGSTKWVLYGVLIVITANVANLSFADFRNRPTAWTHIVSGGFLFGVAFVGILDYYVRKSTALQLTDVQEHVLHAFVWAGLLVTLTGLVALRLNRLYFGDLAGGHSR